MVNSEEGESSVEERCLGHLLTAHYCVLLTHLLTTANCSLLTTCRNRSIREGRGIYYILLATCILELAYLNLLLAKMGRSLLLTTYYLLLTCFNLLLTTYIF